MAEIIDEVTSVERRRVQAHRDLDVDAMQEFLAEDYIQDRRGRRSFLLKQPIN